MGVEHNVEHNEAKNRFEIHVEGKTGVLDYTRQGDALAMNHTGVPPALEGRGLGSQLVRAALDHAREQRLKVYPHCSFVRTYIERHPEYQELVAG